MELTLLPIGSAFGAAIGYIANRLAIWMLFHPINPIKIGPITVQGIFPKKKRAVTERIASVISERVVTRNEIMNIVREAIESRANGNIPIVSKLTPPMLKSITESFLRYIFLGVTNSFLGGAKDEIDVREYILRKFDEVDDKEFEEMFLKAVGKELKYISLNDALLGALIGALEVVFMFILH